MHSVQLRARSADDASLNGMGGIKIHSNPIKLHELHAHCLGVKRHVMLLLRQLAQQGVAGGIVIDVGGGVGLAMTQWGK